MGCAVEVTILIDAHSVTVIQRGTGEVLSEHTIDPDRSYWRNQHKQPGRWPRQATVSFKGATRIYPGTDTPAPAPPAGGVVEIILVKDHDRMDRA